MFKCALTLHVLDDVKRVVEDRWLNEVTLQQHTLLLRGRKVLSNNVTVVGNLVVHALVTHRSICPASVFVSIHSVSCVVPNFLLSIFMLSWFCVFGLFTAPNQFDRRHET